MKYRNTSHNPCLYPQNSKNDLVYPHPHNRNAMPCESARNIFRGHPGVLWNHPGLRQVCIISARIGPVAMIICGHAPIPPQFRCYNHISLFEHSLDTKCSHADTKWKVRTKYHSATSPNSASWSSTFNEQPDKTHRNLKRSHLYTVNKMLCLLSVSEVVGKRI